MAIGRIINKPCPGGISILKISLTVMLNSILVWTTQVNGAPITFNTALPVAKGEFVAREQWVVSQSGDDPSGAGRDRTEASVVTALGYGLTGQWALFGVLPYRDIDLDTTSGGQRVTRSNHGIGDLSLFTRYTAYQHDQPGRTFRVAPFGGVKVPTGNDDAGDGLGMLPASVQVGSGSWDYFAGVVLTYQTLKYQFDSQFSYRVNSEANGIEAGDIARLDGSYQHRLWRSGVQGVPDYLYGVIEVNLIHQIKNRLNNRKNLNSGGTQLFLAPGIQCVTKRWILEGAVQVPLLQGMYGTALENDYIVRAGARFNF